MVEKLSDPLTYGGNIVRAFRITSYTCESIFATANVIGLVAGRAFFVVEWSGCRMQWIILNSAKTPTQQSHLGR